MHCPGILGNFEWNEERTVLYHISLRTTARTLSSNSDKVCAKKLVMNLCPHTWRHRVQPDEMVSKISVPCSQQALFGGFQDANLRISVCQNVAISATEKLRFLKSMPRRSTELWMGFVAVKCSVRILHHTNCSSWENLAKLIACTFWGSYGWMTHITRNATPACRW